MIDIVDVVLSAFRAVEERDEQALAALSHPASSSTGRPRCATAAADAGQRCFPRRAGPGVRSGTRSRAPRSGRWTRGSSPPARARSSRSGSSGDAARRESASR